MPQPSVVQPRVQALGGAFKDLFRRLPCQQWLPHQHSCVQHRFEGAQAEGTITLPGAELEGRAGEDQLLSNLQRLEAVFGVSNLGYDTELAQLRCGAQVAPDSGS